MRRFFVRTIFLLATIGLIVGAAVRADPPKASTAGTAIPASRLADQLGVVTIHGPIDAAKRTWQNLQDRTTSSDRIITWIGDQLGHNWSGHSIDLYLAVPGLVVLVYLAWKNGLASPHMLGMLAIAAQSALILGALGVDFNPIPDRLRRNP